MHPWTRVNTKPSNTIFNHHTPQWTMRDPTSLPSNGIKGLLVHINNSSLHLLFVNLAFMIDYHLKNSDTPLITNITGTVWIGYLKRNRLLWIRCPIWWLKAPHLLEQKQTRAERKKPRLSLQDCKISDDEIYIDRPASHVGWRGPSWPRDGVYVLFCDVPQLGGIWLYTFLIH